MGVVLADPELESLVKWYVDHGWRVESQVGDHVALVKGHPINHLLHLVLTLLTLGLWGLFVWLPLCLLGGEKRRVVTEADAGRYFTGQKRPNTALLS